MKIIVWIFYKHIYNLTPPFLFIKNYYNYLMVIGIIFFIFILVVGILGKRRKFIK